jgi:hypothetical protein
MFDPARLIAPDRVIVWVEALNQLICQFFRYPALIFSVQPGAVHLLTHILPLLNQFLLPGSQVLRQNRFHGDIQITALIRVFHLWHPQPL